MKRKWIYRILPMMLVAVVIILSLLPQKSQAQESNHLSKVYTVQFVTPDADVLSISAREAIIEAIKVWPSTLPENDTFYLISVRKEKTWALATLTSANLDKPLAEGEHTHLKAENLIALLLVETEQGWQAAIDVDDKVHMLLGLIPESELSQSARLAMFPPKDQIRQPPMTDQQQYSNYKLPWPAGQAWWMSNSQGWHSTGGYDPGYALDFDIVSQANSDILAAAPGTVVWVCAGYNDQYFLSIRTDGASEQFGYLHLNGATVRAEGIQMGTHVDQGTKLGQMRYADNGAVSDNCGISNGTHIHLNFPTKPFTIDGITFTQSDVHYLEHIYSSQGNSDTEQPNTTITSGASGWIGTSTTTFQWTGTDNQTSLSNLMYSYKLDGYSNWSDWTSSTNKTYNALSDRAYTFQVKARDQAGNQDSSPATRSFSVDTTSPSSPNITISGPGCNGIQNNGWQNTCYDPAFTWNASDSGSGIKDYQYYWGTSSNGSPETWTTSAAFDPVAITPADGHATYYLNAVARDNLSHKSGVSTFGVLFDGTLPIINLEINGGAATTNQVNVQLNLSADDTGSGVADVRVSNNGSDWYPWQPYSDGVSWTLPALDRQDHTVYVQVRDRAGNESAIDSDIIHLDLYPLMPHSDNYRICTDVVDAGGSIDLGSPNYSLISAVGQPWVTGADTNVSSGYSEQSGFLSDLTACLPITHSVGTDYEITQWVMASGGNLRSSTNYRLGDTAGEAAASGAAEFASTNYQLSSGFWAQVGSISPTYHSYATTNLHTNPDTHSQSDGNSTTGRFRR